MAMIEKIQATIAALRAAGMEPTAIFVNIDGWLQVRKMVGLSDICRVPNDLFGLPIYVVEEEVGGPSFHVGVGDLSLSARFPYQGKES